MKQVCILQLCVGFQPFYIARDQLACKPVSLSCTCSTLLMCQGIHLFGLHQCWRPIQQIALVK